VSHPEGCACRLCHLRRTSPAYRKLWALRLVECTHLGGVIRKGGCSCRREDVRRCAAGHGAVRQAVDCETCADYQADE
jgi:hypothetical protein